MAAWFEDDDLVLGVRNAARDDEANPDWIEQARGDRVQLIDFYDPQNRIEEFTFADGTNLSVEGILGRLGTVGDDVISWTDTRLDLDAGAGDDTVTAGAADDHLRGGAGADTLDGAGGDDTLDGGAGADLLYGGAGVDTADYADASESVVVDLAAGTASDGDRLSGVENARGGAGDDALIGDGQANALYGGAGADTLDGGAGADRLDGGAGADRILLGIGGGNDVVASGAGDVLAFGPGVAASQLWFAIADDVLAITLLATGETVTVTGWAEENRAARIELADGATLDADGVDALVAAMAAYTTPVLTPDGSLPDAVATVVDPVAAAVWSDGAGAESGAADYSDQTSGVTVDLETGGVQHGVDLSGATDVRGSANADVIRGDDGVNVLLGQDGDDLLEGRAGGDLLIGGAGRDTASYAASGAGVDVDLNTGAAAGGHAEGDALSGIENLTGSDHADTLAGDAGANTLSGGAGDDVLNGGAGADALYGGAGRDQVNYAASSAAVAIDLAAASAAGGDAEGDQLSSIEHVVGSAFDDALSGSGAAETFAGGDGADRLDGRAGDDALYGGAGDDLFIGGAGADAMSGGSGLDEVRYDASSAAVTIDLASGVGAGGDASGDQLESIEVVVGSDHDDAFIGGAGDDAFIGGGGDDVFIGGGGADSLDGGAGRDRVDYAANGDDGVVVNLAAGIADRGDARGDQLTDIEDVSGSSGADIVLGDDADNQLVGRGGDDILFGADGADTLDGDGGADQLDGGAGDDTLSGGAGADTLAGGLGDDTLFGDGGDDTLSGGAGDDRYVVEFDGGGADVIQNDAADENAEDDLLILSGPMTKEDVWFEQIGDDLEVSAFGLDGSVTIEDWFADDAARVDRIQLADDQEIAAADVDRLASDMAAFSKPTTEEMRDDVEAALKPTIDDAWKALDIA